MREYHGKSGEVCKDKMKGVYRKKVKKARKYKKYKKGGLSKSDK